MLTAQSLSKDTALFHIVECIFKQNPLQKKRIKKYFESKADAQFWEFAEDLSKTLQRNLLIDSTQMELAAKAYNKMCQDFLSEQIKFKKTGVYSCLEASDANQKVYEDPIVMRYYMIGLLVSYMFWPNHYELFKFFKENLPMIAPKNYLEVGVGHGLFTSTMIKKYPAIDPTIVDISATSIAVATEVLSTFQVDTKKIKFTHKDFLKLDLSQKYEFVIMGEVLEHVNDAPLFLEKTKNILSENGRIYLSTCANSPALDHVYHFHNVQEIRDLLTSKGFHIVKDLALAAEDIPEEKWEQELVTVNYCAVLEHARGST